MARLRANGTESLRVSRERTHDPDAHVFTKDGTDLGPSITKRAQARREDKSQMSAFMVSKTHIDGLVHAAYFGPRDVRGLPQSGHWRKPPFEGWHDWGFERMNDVGEMLVKENLSSIHARYPDTISDPENTPGPIAQYWQRPYMHETPTRKMGVVEALKALDCYEYQSCEHPQWEKSQAFEFCRSMRRSLIGCLPGYDAAPWGWDDAQVAA